jgi:signal transduction histidine kinase
MPALQRRVTDPTGGASVRLWPLRLLLSPAPVVAFGLIGLGTIFWHGHWHGATPIHSRLGLAVALVIGLVALLFRRRHPFAVLAVVLIDATIANFSPALTPVVLVSVLTIAMLRTRRETVAAALITAVVVLLTPAVHGHPLTQGGDIVSRVVSIGLAVALGLYLRARQDYIAGLHDRAERLERERELLAQQAVADERVRIARELHDAVAHNVSLMVVQAQALGAAGADAQTQPTLERIAGLGREALSEMHRMLGVLRLDTQEGAEREPQPGVGDIDALVAQVRETGLDTVLHVEGEPRQLSAGVDLSAYRIVQEALTNVIRHAHAGNALVTVRYATDALELQIADDGVGAEANGSNGSGHGLVGMRERVALFGGELRVGAGPTGRGYLVHAVLPLR